MDWKVVAPQSFYDETLISRVMVFDGEILRRQLALDEVINARFHDAIIMLCLWGHFAKWNKSETSQWLYDLM